MGMIPNLDRLAVYTLTEDRPRMKSVKSLGKKFLGSLN